MYEAFHFHIKLKRMFKLSISSKPLPKALPFSLFLFFFSINLNFFSRGISLMTYFISDTEQLSSDAKFP